MFVVFDNRIALDYILAEQGGVCSVINTSCCIWINVSGRVKTELDKIQAQTNQMLNAGPTDNPLGLRSFMYLPLGIASWFRSVFQFGLSILSIILGIVIVVKLCLLCIVQCYKDANQTTATQVFQNGLCDIT